MISTTGAETIPLSYRPTSPLDRWFSGKVSALHPVVTDSIYRGRDHVIHFNVPLSIATTLKYMRGHLFFRCFVQLTLDPYLIMLSVKQRCILYCFLSLWYDSIWDWTPVSRAIDEYTGNLLSKVKSIWYLSNFQQIPKWNLRKTCWTVKSY